MVMGWERHYNFLRFAISQVPRGNRVRNKNHKDKDGPLVVKFRQRLAALPRRSKRAIMVVADATGIVSVTAGALWLTDAAPPLEGPLDDAQQADETGQGQ